MYYSQFLYLFRFLLACNQFKERKKEIVYAAKLANFHVTAFHHNQCSSPPIRNNRLRCGVSRVFTPFLPTYATTVQTNYCLAGKVIKKKRKKVWWYEERKHSWSIQQNSNSYTTKSTTIVRGRKETNFTTTKHMHTRQHSTRTSVNTCTEIFNWWVATSYILHSSIHSNQASQPAPTCSSHHTQTNEMKDVTKGKKNENQLIWMPVGWRLTMACNT